MSFRLVFNDKVAALDRKRRLKRGWKDRSGDSQFEYEDLGWFVRLNGSTEALFVGQQKPDIAVGQIAKVTIDFGN